VTQPERAPTAVERRDAIDVARVLALALVVAGHLAMAVIDRDGNGAVRGTNMLLLYPRWSFLAAAAPMPVFFAAGGWANATTPPQRAAPRLRTLVGLALAVVGCWSLAVLVASAIRGGDPGVLGQGARLATQPLWFLAAYVPFAFWGRSLARAAIARPAAVIGGCLLLLGALDVIHFGFDGPGWLAWPAFYLAWGTPWLAGCWWREQWTPGGFAERRVGIALAAGAGVGAWILVWRAGYQASLIDYGSDGRSNTNPPTLYTAVVGLAQVGVLMLVAPKLDRLGARFRTIWDRAGSAAIGVYVWHLTALSLCVGVVAIPDVPAPRRLSAAWWLLRPVWIVAVLGCCAVLVGATASIRALLRTRARTAGAAPAPVARLALGTVVAAAGGAVIGLYGPATVPRAIVCCALLGAGWVMLRTAEPTS
jgi:hypothetical protein